MPLEEAGFPGFRKLSCAWQNLPCLCFMRRRSVVCSIRSSGFTVDRHPRRPLVNSLYVSLSQYTEYSLLRRGINFHSRATYIKASPAPSFVCLGMTPLSAIFFKAPFKCTRDYSNTIRLRTFPIRSISTQTTSPFFRNSSGFMNNPTPPGVPVMIKDPLTLTAESHQLANSEAQV